jgi:hypothetical protein
MPILVTTRRSVSSPGSPQFLAPPLAADGSISPLQPVIVHTLSFQTQRRCSYSGNGFPSGSSPATLPTGTPPTSFHSTRLALSRYPRAVRLPGCVCGSVSGFSRLIACRRLPWHSVLIVTECRVLCLGVVPRSISLSSSSWSGRGLLAASGMPLSARLASSPTATEYHHDFSCQPLDPAPPPLERGKVSKVLRRIVTVYRHCCIHARVE